MAKVPQLHLDLTSVISTNHNISTRASNAPSINKLELSVSQPGLSTSRMSNGGITSLQAARFERKMSKQREDSASTTTTQQVLGATLRTINLLTEESLSS